MNQTNHRERTPYEKKLFWRKARMYAVWAVTFVACLVVSLSAFNRRFLEINDPQIKGAYVQIAKLLPTDPARLMLLRASDPPPVIVR